MEDWIHVNKSSGNGDDQVQVTLDENRGGLRESAVFVNSVDGSAEAWCDISQSGSLIYGKLRCSYELMYDVDDPEMYEKVEDDVKVQCNIYTLDTPFQFNEINITGLRTTQTQESTTETNMQYSESYFKANLDNMDLKIDAGERGIVGKIYDAIIVFKGVTEMGGTVETSVEKNIKEFLVAEGDNIIKSSDFIDLNGLNIGYPKYDEERHIRYYDIHLQLAVTYYN